MAVNEQILRDLLDKVAAEQGYENPQINITKISNIGANFTSFLYEATISSKDKDDLNLFAKIAAISQEMRSLAPMKVYEVEGHFYKHLLAAYRMLEEDHNVAKEDRLLTPAFYGLHPTQYEETLILENLKCKGFTTLDRFDVLTWEYACKAVKELTKFHALSFAYAKEFPEKFAEDMNRFKLDLKLCEVMQPAMKTMTEKALSTLSDENKPKLLPFLDQLSDPEEMLKYLSQATILKHGDFRASNLMHKINENGELIVMPIDYQTIQPGDPLADLFYLVFTGTDAAFRRDHWQTLLDYYYDQLCAAMRRLDVDPEEAYSRKHFEKTLKETLSYGLFVSLTILPLVVVEEPPRVGSEHIISDFLNMKAGEVYKERLNDIVSDFVDWGVL